MRTILTAVDETMMWALRKADENVRGSLGRRRSELVIFAVDSRRPKEEGIAASGQPPDEASGIAAVRFPLMKTIRRFNNVAEAGFAQSLLESAGLTAVLADDLTFALGPQYVPWGIRLQVAEEDLGRAEKILEEHEGYEPLPEDFVPPETEVVEMVGSPDARAAVMGRGAAFLLGGVLALLTVGCASVLLSAATENRNAWRFTLSPNFPILLFLVGGWIGLGIRATYAKRGRRLKG